MAKGFILVDMPENCLNCIFCRETHEGIEACCELEDNPKDDRLIRDIDVNYTQDKPDWCPIRELPKRKKPMTIGTLSPMIKEQYYEFDSGYNACLDYMEGKDGNL